MIIARLARFVRENGGAVTVDWVVLTAAVVGLGFAVISTVNGSTGSAAAGVASGVVNATSSSGSSGGSASGDLGTTPFNGKKAADYVAYGQSKAPGNNGAAYYWAGQAASADAPPGYNYNNPIYDQGSGNVVYTSNDGSNYSVGGKVYSKASYTGTTSYFGA